ncbi:MAG: TIGR01212 family radical SAM protein [Muribaculaceae bacterium]|nr:TIGR01212 family radical SAM protein [Muribaculaceae bacterium]
MYKTYREYLQEKFGAVRVQKLSIDAGFSCPNRDGTIARGGCIYCNVRSFTPGYCNPRDSISQQLEEGKRFFARKYPDMKYLAYFQSFTGTHSAAVESLRALYEQAASTPDVVGIVIGTRPDCLPPQIMDLLEEFNRRVPVIVEIGAETSRDDTLQRINRGHTWHDVAEAAENLHARGISVGVHLIAGLPGESDEDVLATVEKMMELPVDTVKFHQLQVIRDTRLSELYQNGAIDVVPYRMEDYLNLCQRIVARIVKRRPDIAIERFLSSAPKGMVVAPDWGIKNHEFVNLLHNRLLKTKNTEKSEKSE